MRNLYLILGLLLLFPVLAFAQADTSTVTVETLIGDAKDVYSGFMDVGVLAGIAALINILVNLTKFGPVSDFIRMKGWKWIRPLLAVAAGVVAGVIAGLAEDKSGVTLLLYVLGGMMSGGGAIAIHELLAVLKGERKGEPA